MAFVAEGRLRSQVSPCEICGGQCGTGASLSPKISVLVSQYQSKNAPRSSSSTCCTYQKEKLVRTIQTTLFRKRGRGGALDRKVSKLLNYVTFTRTSNLYNTTTTVKTVLTSESSSNHPAASVIQKCFTLSQLIK